MNDYISRTAVEKILEKAQIISDGENCGYCTQDVNITAIPAVDVLPVVHGEWIEYPLAHYFKCSVCKHIVPYRKAVLINGKREYNYCPYCNAMMSGKESNG